jgi:hypothetical protein
MVYQQCYDKNYTLVVQEEPKPHDKYYSNLKTTIQTEDPSAFGDKKPLPLRDPKTVTPLRLQRKPRIGT